MKTKSFWVFAMLVIVTCDLSAQLSSKYPGYLENVYQSTRYGLFVPENYSSQEPYPLIAYLHGANDTISRDIRWYQKSVQSENPCFVLTPKCLNPDQGWGNTWNNGHTIDTKNTLQLIDSLLEVYPIDKNRFYIYGISMGGFGVFSVLQKEPGKFAAAYVVCGGGKEGEVSNMLNTPLWVFHGEEDDVVSIRYARQVVESIVRLGGDKAKFTTYPGVKHNSWENVAKEKELVTWLFEK